MSATLRNLAKALGGEVPGRSVLAPGPGHKSKGDRSLSVTLDPAAPDGFLVHSFAGDDFRICRDHVRKPLAGGAFAPRAVKPEKAPRPALWPALWRRAKDPRGTLAEKYLRGRRLDLPEEAAGEALRFDPHCQFGKGAEAEHDPAMICLVRNIVSNEPQGIQRTALTFDGNAVKRDGKTLRMSLGIVKGGAIKIDPDEQVEQGVCIGEGVETCLSGRKLGYAPVWSVITNTGIEDFPVLSGLGGLTIFVE